MKYLSGLFLCLLCLILSVTAYADATPPGFSADISKPTPQMNIAPPQADDKAASMQSTTVVIKI